MLAVMAGRDKPVVWLAGEVKTPPFSKEGRIEVAKRTRVTPRRVIEACQERLGRYDRAAG